MINALALIKTDICFAIIQINYFSCNYETNTEFTQYFGVAHLIFANVFDNTNYVILVFFYNCLHIKKKIFLD